MKILGFLILYLALEATYAPDAQLSAWGARGVVRGYQATLSLVFSGTGGRCRYTPSCSEYGRLCFEKYGTLRGGWMTIKRVVQCAPWGPPAGPWPP